MADKELAPYCDILRTFFLEKVEPTTFAVVPDTDSVISGWLGLAANDDAPPDPSLVATISHVGVATPDETHPYPLGTWGVEVDATLLTAPMVALFADGSPSGGTGFAYLILQTIGGVRKYERLKVVEASAAELV